MYVTPGNTHLWFDRARCYISLIRNLECETKGTTNTKMENENMKINPYLSARQLSH